MRKLAVVLSLVLSVSLHAHDPEEANACRTLDRPPDDQIVQMYTSLAELPLEQQRKQLWALSSDTRAALWTYNIQRYMHEHPELSFEAQEIFRHAVALINTPAWFDIQKGSFGYTAKTAALAELKERIQASVTKDVIIEVFIRLGPEPEVVKPIDTEPPQVGDHPRLQPRTEIFHNCTCASYYDCGSSDSYDCFDSYCMETIAHCGYLGDEGCWGRCKSTGL